MTEVLAKERKTTRIEVFDFLKDWMADHWIEISPD